jgi:hypothetical protein
MEESDGVCSTQTAAGSDTAEDAQNNTVIVQMEEEERVIRVMPFVTTLSFVRETCRVYEVAQDGMGRIWLPWSWKRSVGWPWSHDKIKGHSRHHPR